MSALSISLLKVELREPLIITRKIGKGGFYSSLNVIPGSTILGALSRDAILYNVRNRRGGCSGLDSPNSPPPCESCAEEDCPYILLWREHRVKISDALPSIGNGQKLGDVETIPELQSIFRGKKSGALVDGLLFNAAQRMALRKEAPKDLLIRRLRIDGDEVKRNPETVTIHPSTGNEIRIEEVTRRSYSSTHVSINPRFRASEKALLFSIDAYPEGSIFLCNIIGEPAFIDEYVKNHEVRLGASRSRGYGLAHIKVIEETSLEKYFEMRSKVIEKGFDEIQRFLSSYDVNTPIGTITGLSPLPLVRRGRSLNPRQAVSERIGISPSKLITLMYRRGVRPRWDGDSFIFTPSLNPGYAAAFTLQGDVQDEAFRLARAEIELLDEIPGYGWIYLNHPIHYASRVSYT